MYTCVLEPAEYQSFPPLNKKKMNKRLNEQV